jgi:sporulation protein YlmC with PRC-barrel domain
VESINRDTGGAIVLDDIVRGDPMVGTVPDTVIATNLGDVSTIFVANTKLLPTAMPLLCIYMPANDAETGVPTDAIDVPLVLITTA